ncbi:hypothetical protein BIV60_00370 [Bacillus sp. MUM 116]|uniref:hypothetical protein n=1 Tax=Bacillus sp. MUM 116 TaxID=1678002 RepID=UPI0008F55D84|nr:hypothetical protein [Bacillus sp. MUM 116]OIK17182.1 hypothetical protein BIV60_00370 [Bacillus sp. MUM 116]
MNTNKLREWAENHSIESKTIEGFWDNLSSYKYEQEKEFREIFGDDFDKVHLRVIMDSLALFIDKWNKDSYHSYGFDYIVSYLPIVYKGEQVGEYKMLFNLKGDSFYDYFVTH